MRHTLGRRIVRTAALVAAVGVALLPSSGFVASAGVAPGDEGGGGVTRRGVAVAGEMANAVAEEAESIEVIVRRQTTVSGVGGSTVRIQIPVGVVLDLGRGGSGKSFAGADLEGTGPARGFVLSDNLATEDGGHHAYAWQLSDDFAGVVHTAGFGTFEESERDRFRIPAGTYSLYLISDGSPLTLTLEFDALIGETTIAATRTVPLDFRVLRNRAAGGDAQHSLYSTGQRASFLDGPGFHAITIASKTAGETAVGISGFCYYVGAVSNEDTAYLPGCPNEITDGADVKERRVNDPTAGVLVQAFRGVSAPSGLFAMGYWRETSMVPEHVAALGYTLQYDRAFASDG